jgi:GNAT superfamily N-acetyltransferase
MLRPRRDVAFALRSMPITISLDPARQDLDAIHRMLASTYWSPGIRRDVVAEALRNSMTAVAIDDATGATVGLARVVTDRATFAWLCDVFVDERFRGQGISKRLLEELERHPSLEGVRRWCLATRDAHGLYEKFGYRPVPADRWMEKQGPKERWQDGGP